MFGVLHCLYFSSEDPTPAVDDLELAESAADVDVDLTKSLNLNLSEVTNKSIKLIDPDIA